MAPTNHPRSHGGGVEHMAVLETWYSSLRFVRLIMMTLAAQQKRKRLKKNGSCRKEHGVN
jgi:hypothetical protein